MDPLLVKNLVLLPLRKTFEILEKCFPEYIQEIYGTLVMLLRKTNIEKTTVDFVRPPFGRGPN